MTDGGRETLVRAFGDGRRSALARVISRVEDEAPGFEALLDEVLRSGRTGERIGLTGPPGAGKSTLVSAMAEAYRAQGLEVGVVAVDPTSPFSGGALLGDRIRMGSLSLDPGIFVRSMASRSALGGLATTTREVVDVVEAFGFDRILVETVGVGQTDLEVTGAVDTVVVVLVPESGDAVQAMKAGLMEIADVFVVNKADRPGADRVVRELEQALEMRGEGATGGAGPGGWSIPVIPAVGPEGRGVDELLGTLDAHRTWLRESGELEGRSLRRARTRILEVVERRLRRRIRASAADVLDRGARAVVAGDATPYSAAREILGTLD